MTEIKLCRIRIGISACLVGELVRYDGGHKHCPHLVDDPPPDIQWVPVCPEAEMGLGVPREKIHLVAEGATMQLRVIASSHSLTADMTLYAIERTARLALQGLSGYIFKKDSPSCGRKQVNVFDPPSGTYRRTGIGLFAAQIQSLLPDLPVADESELASAAEKRAFFARARAYRPGHQDRS